MSILMLACGPYIDTANLWVSIVVFLVFKPLAYFGFIQAFRYRVSRPIPMTYRRAAMLTLARAGLGVVILGLGAAFIALSGREPMLVWSWLYLYVTRAAAWFIVGWWGARLRGRRLAGWIISGMMINAAFDFAVLFGLFGGWIFPVGALLFLGVFIGLLDRFGRRTALQTAYSTATLCRRCSYDLTGNHSGRCPECSMVV